MTAHRHSLLRLLGFLGTLGCPIVLVVLFEIRPPLPRLPTSLSSPITLELVRSVLELAAWGVAIVLAFLLLVHSLRGLFVRRAPRPSRPLHFGVPGSRQRQLGRTRLARGSAQGGFPPPFPLLVRHPSDLEYAAWSACEQLSAATAQAVQTDEPAPECAPTAPPQALPPPSIALLGPLQITPSQRRRRGLRSQTQQLLTYLALHAEGATADELIAVLWPDVDDRKAKKQLWRSISDARLHLGEVILRTDERYRLDHKAVAIDLDLLEQLLIQADAERGADRAEVLKQALALVRGGPLAGADYPWAAGDIRRLDATIVELLEELGRVRLGNGNPTGALGAAEQALQFDLCNEAAHRLAMQAEAALGLRQAIVDRYEQLSRELDTRLGLEPERETRLLYRRLLSQESHALRVSTGSG
jgi:DNA-binding SARP family transcriptional activator